MGAVWGGTRWLGSASWPGTCDLGSPRSPCLALSATGLGSPPIFVQESGAAPIPLPLPGVLFCFGSRKLRPFNALPKRDLSIEGFDISSLLSTSNSNPHSIASAPLHQNEERPAEKHTPSGSAPIISCPHLALRDSSERRIYPSALRLSPVARLALKCRGLGPSGCGSPRRLGPRQ